MICCVVVLSSFVKFTLKIEFLKKENPSFLANRLILGIVLLALCIGLKCFSIIAPEPLSFGIGRSPGTEVQRDGPVRGQSELELRLISSLRSEKLECIPRKS
ncbi:hypothetical protein Tco_0351348 [Tanacetum coccineum]